MSSKRRGAWFASLAIAAAACAWGLWPLWVRLGGEGGARAGAAAFVVAGVLGLPLALVDTRRREAAGAVAGGNAWVWLVVLGFLDAANVWCYFRALAEGQVAPAVLSHYLSPVILAAVAPWLLREPRSPRTPWALSLALAGTAALVVPAMQGDLASPATSRALLLGATSALFYASTTVVSKRIGHAFTNAELMVYHAIVAAVILVPAAGLPPGGAARHFWLIAGGALSGLGGGLLFFAGLRTTPAERVGVLTYLEPLAAVLVGWIAFAETPHWTAALGGALILAAGLLVVTAPPVGPAASPP